MVQNELAELLRELRNLDIINQDEKAKKIKRALELLGYKDSDIKL
jgi:hypothetical protein